MATLKKQIPPIPDSIWRQPLHFIAFGFGSGAMPIAPGTFGTLMAVPFYLIASHLPLVGYLICTLILTVSSIWVCHQVSKTIGIHDHPGMCLDEFAGFFITMLAIPPKLSCLIIGFLLFRLFDIWKPWPIGFIDRRLTGGLGMVLDDILAGVYACLILNLFHKWIW